MTLSKEKVLDFASGAGFVVLFPGFFLYHLGVAYDAIPAFAGGLFGYAALFLFPLFILTIPKVWKQNRTSPYFWVLLSLMVYVSVLAFLHFSLGTSHGVGLATVQTLETVVLWGALFFVGFFLPWQSRFLQRSILLFAIGLLLFLIFFVISTGSVMLDARRVSSADGVATYQGFARSAVASGLFLFAVYAGIRAKAVVLIGSGFVLFLLGARSELFGFLASVSVLSLIYSLRSVRYLFGFSVAFIVLTTAAWFSLDYLLMSRQLQVLDIEASSSWIARMELQQIAVQQISENPLFGQFGGHIANGDVGSYAHNWLSAWVNFGLLGVILYLFLVCVAAIRSGARVWGEKRGAIDWELSFLVNGLVLILVLVAKSVFWPLPALGWGLYLAAVARERVIRVYVSPVVLEGHHQAAPARAEPRERRASKKPAQGIACCQSPAGDLVG